MYDLYSGKYLLTFEYIAVLFPKGNELGLYCILSNGCAGNSRTANSVKPTTCLEFQPKLHWKMFLALMLVFPPLFEMILQILQVASFLFFFVKVHTFLPPFLIVESFQIQNLTSLHMSCLHCATETRSSIDKRKQKPQRRIGQFGTDSWFLSLRHVAARPSLMSDTDDWCFGRWYKKLFVGWRHLWTDVCGQ